MGESGGGGHGGERLLGDVTTGQFLAENAAAILREAGAKNVYPQEAGRGLSGGQHQAGTCRMGADPQYAAEFVGGTGDDCGAD